MVPVFLTVGEIGFQACNCKNPATIGLIDKSHTSLIKIWSFFFSEKRTHGAIDCAKYHAVITHGMTVSIKTS